MVNVRVSINGITGQSPYDIYICQSSLNDCIYIDTITGTTLTFDLPKPIDNSLEYIMKVVDNNNFIITGSSIVNIPPIPSRTPTRTVTPTITPTITVTPTITPTQTLTPTITPTNTITPTQTVTPTNTITPTNTPSTTPIPSLLLDLYPSAAVAYSLRKLRSAYTGSAIRVRRSSDNTEQDIGFTGNDLNTTALTTFVGAGNGFVVTWYDQSENANNAIMTTQANQPQIVSSGSVILTNGKPSVNFDGTNDSLNLSSSLTFANTGSLISFVGKRAASGERLYSLSGSQYSFALWSDNKYYIQSRTNGYELSTNTDTTTNQLLLSGVNNGTNQLIYKNNSVVSSSFVALTLQTGISNIGNYSSLFSKSNLQEIIFYNFENSSNLNAINTNINTHYAIY